MNIKDSFGIMQGRLSPMVDGKIQAFPWNNWKNEFVDIGKLGLNLIEWTIDFDENYYNNPIMSSDGRKIISELCEISNCRINSVTADSLMHAPFWKQPANRKLYKIADDLIDSCIALDINILVVPLVDNGSISSLEEEQLFTKYFLNKEELLRKNNLEIAIESDLIPSQLNSFVRHFPDDILGINYDIGNSASLGYSPSEELELYGDRVINVHIKDRKFNGATVPLGMGDADFNKVFEILLQRQNYRRNFIYQTARNPDNLGIMKSYLSFINSIPSVREFFTMQ